jgi:RNA polymerase sigma-70 factor (ECF subfamily)
MTHDEVSQATLDAARSRDPDAVAAIYGAYAADLYRFFMGALRDRETAEDLVAGVFVGVVESLPRFRGPAAALGGWLFRIARHDLYDYRRRRARAPTVEPLDLHLDAAWQAPDPQDLAVAGLEHERLLAVVRELPPGQRDVLLLRLVADLPVREVARLIGRTVGATKALQHRALANLARRIQPALARNGGTEDVRAPGGATRRRPQVRAHRTAQAARSQNGLARPGPGPAPRRAG